MAKETLLHRALGYKGQLLTYRFKNGSVDECFSEDVENYDGKLSLIPMYTWSKYSSLRDVLSDKKYSPDNLVVSIPKDSKSKFSEEESKYMSAEHAYNLMEYSDNNF